jgi:membrane protein involved in colicin uptake
LVQLEQQVQLVQRESEVRPDQPVAQEIKGQLESPDQQDLEAQPVQQEEPDQQDNWDQRVQRGQQAQLAV